MSNDTSGYPTNYNFENSDDDHRRAKDEDGSPEFLESDADSQDAIDMSHMGKKQQLRRTFSFWSILAFSTVSMLTWSAQLITFIQGLENGGPGGLVISFLLSWTGMAAIIASLAELLSMWPTSGGQYHWTFILSSEEWADFLSYAVGWQGVMAWQALVASAVYLSGNMMEGLIILNHPSSYHPHPWRVLLLIYAVIAVATAINLHARWLPKFEIGALIIFLAGFVVVLVTITVMSPSKATAHDVFQVFNNQGNWSSQGVSWWVGLQGVIFAWLGTDGAIHMAEEVRSASRIIPPSLVGSAVVNGTLGFAILIAVLFCGGNLDDALDSPTGYPFMAMFSFATGSVSGGTGLSVIILLTQMFPVIAVMAAASRELWAFARDRGIPGATRIMRVHRSSKLPLWALAVTVTVSTLLSLIVLGSTVALNAVISLSIASFMSSYFIPIGLLLYRRVQALRGTGRELPWGPWALGRWPGILVNSYALVWIVLIWVWSFFPATVKPSVETMNWSCLAYGAVEIFALLFWFVDGKRRFQGPVRDAADGETESFMKW